jgi:hypothetical protein
MAKQSNFYIVKNLLNITQSLYPIVSILIGLLTFIVFLIFSMKVKVFAWNFDNLLKSVTISTLIAFEISGIQYILGKNKIVLDGLRNVYFWSNSNPYDRFETRLKESPWRYTVVLSPVVISIIIEIYYIYSGFNIFAWKLEQSYWSMMLDIYSQLLNLIIYFLLGILLWINVDMGWTLIKIGDESLDLKLKISIYSIVIELNPLRNLILKISAIYFICITLAIISGFTPVSLLSPETVLFISLLLFGVVFFIEIIGVIRKLTNHGIDSELKEVNDRIQDQKQKIIRMAYEENYFIKKEELESISSMLEILHKERERLLQLQISQRGVNLLTIGTFISTFLLPLLTLFEKLQSLKLI